MFVVLLLLTVSGFAVWEGYIDSNKKNETAGQNAKVNTQGKFNILVLGIDQRKNDIGRSNVTCLMTVDMDQKTISLLWIPRDSRVDIPGYEWNKIGHAYAYGGPELSKKTVSRFLGVPVDYYLAINMAGFKNVIDAFGGVDINVDKAMYYYDKYDEGEVDNDGLIDLKPGLQHMDGNTALEYVRFRHDEMGDIGRIERQQKFAKALLEDAVNPSVIVKLPNIMKQVNASFETDIPLTDLIALSTIAKAAYQKGLDAEMVSGTPVYIDDISYWLPDIQAMRKQVATLQAIEVTNSYEDESKKMADEYKNSTKNMKVIIAP
jgi:polyisoprenyl-teichoic acid--peptidoglycan teichoic acid transferase